MTLFKNHKVDTAFEIGWSPYCYKLVVVKLTISPQFLPTFFKSSCGGLLLHYLMVL